MDSSNIAILLNSTSLLIAGTSLFINGTLITEDVYEKTSVCTAYTPRRSDFPLVIFIIFMFLAGSFLGFGFGAVARKDSVKVSWGPEETWRDEKFHEVKSFEASRERENETGFTLLEQREKREKVMGGSVCERDGVVGGSEIEMGMGCGFRLAMEENVGGVVDGPWREPNLFLSS